MDSTTQGQVVVNLRISWSHMRYVETLCSGSFLVMVRFVFLSSRSWDAQRSTGGYESCSSIYFLHMIFPFTLTYCIYRSRVELQILKDTIPCLINHHEWFSSAPIPPPRSWTYTQHYFTYPRLPRKASSAPSHEGAPSSASATQMAVARRWKPLRLLPTSSYIIHRHPISSLLGNGPFWLQLPSRAWHEISPSLPASADRCTWIWVFWGMLGRHGGDKGYRIGENRDYDRTTWWKHKRWRSWIVGYLMAWTSLIVQTFNPASTFWATIVYRFSSASNTTIGFYPFHCAPSDASLFQRLITAPSRFIRHHIVFW